MFRPVDGCTAEPETSEPYPALCAVHLRLFLPLIENRARILAACIDDPYSEPSYRVRPHRMPRRPRVAVKNNAILNADDQRVLAFLEGTTP